MNRRPTGLLLLAAVLPFGFVVACSSDPEPGPEPGGGDAATTPSATTTATTPPADASAPPVDATKPPDTGVDAAKPPTCTDGAKNGSETDVDCGGSCLTKCATSRGCATAADCVTATCISGVCRAATATDGVKNGSETDVDCGGPDPPACPPATNKERGGGWESKSVEPNKRPTHKKTEGVKNDNKNE